MVRAPSWTEWLEGRMVTIRSMDRGVGRVNNTYWGWSYVFSLFSFRLPLAVFSLARSELGGVLVCRPVVHALIHLFSAARLSR